MRLLCLLLAVLSSIALAQDAPPLASLKDKSRVLLVFTASGRSPAFEQQIDILEKASADIKERDLVIIPILPSTGEPTSADTLRTAHPQVASETEQLALRHRFHVAPGEFAVILIGKDGGEKLRQHTPITAQKLNQVIDAMPMRKEEMRRRQ
jgi:hypothetical protein